MSAAEAGESVRLPLWLMRIIASVLPVLPGSDGAKHDIFPIGASPMQQKSGKLGWVVGCIVCLLIGLFVGHAVTYHLMDHHHHGTSVLNALSGSPTY